MSKSLATFVQTAELPALSENQISDALSEITQDSGVQTNVDYMSFSGKTGRYAMGRDRNEPEDTLFIVEPQSVVEGWVCWKGQKPVDRIEWSVYERAKAKKDLEELPDHSPYRERTERLGGGPLEPKCSFGLSTSLLSGSLPRARARLRKMLYWA